MTELEQRVQVLEYQVITLQALVNRLLETQPLVNPKQVSDEISRKEDIPTEAPGIENLRAMLIAHGVLPGDEVVRQIIAGMRDDEEIDE